MGPRPFIHIHISACCEWTTLIIASQQSLAFNYMFTEHTLLSKSSCREMQMAFRSKIERGGQGATCGGTHTAAGNAQAYTHTNTHTLCSASLYHAVTIPVRRHWQIHSYFSNQWISLPWLQHEDKMREKNILLWLCVCTPCMWTQVLNLQLGS